MEFIIKDLTYSIDEDMIYFDASWHTKVSISQLGTLGSVGRETRKLTLGSHSGTHVDAPLHFFEGGKGIDTIPLEKLMGEISIIDFSHLAENESVTADMLGKLTISQKMMFKFGWGKHWNSPKFYRDYPYFSKEAAEYLISQNVEMMVLDTPSPDDSRIKLTEDVIGTEKDSPIHKIFLNNKVILVEYVANLDDITDYKGWNIVVAPLKLKGADGSPARVWIYKVV